MKTFSIQKFIFLLIAGILFTDLSVKAYSSSSIQKGLGSVEYLNLRELPGIGNVAEPDGLPGNDYGDWI